MKEREKPEEKRAIPVKEEVGKGSCPVRPGDILKAPGGG